MSGRCRYGLNHTFNGPVGLSCHQSWGEDRVMYRDEEGRVRSLPASWTTAGAVNPYVALSAGRSLLHLQDLLALVDTVRSVVSVRESERAEDDRGLIDVETQRAPDRMKTDPSESTSPRRWRGSQWCVSIPSFRA